jgi:hypothetical protein
MPSERVSRPRTLSVVFGFYFLLMAIIAWYSGGALGYHYTVDITRWTFSIFLLVGAVFLVGIVLAALWSMRYLDARIAKLEGASAGDEEIGEETVVDEPIPDEMPPPLEEAPAPSGDHVDRDIDELLVSLQEMEAEAETASEVAEAETPVTVATRPRPAVAAQRRVSSLMESKQLAALRKKRDGIAYYFGGPVLAAIGAIGISAAMLPGSDAFLQTYNELNTSLLLGLGYTFVGIAAYVATSILLMTRTK